MGSFTDASRQLLMTQSTVAKRVVELEAAIGKPLFIRNGKTLCLTRVGERLLPEAQAMMRQHERIVEAITPASHLEGHIRIGATDLVGLTWLPALIQEVRLRFPRIRVTPEIDGGVRLYERLERNELDIIIIPGPFAGPTMSTFPLGRITNAWMASPDLELPDGVLSVQQISALTILYRSWFKENGFSLNNVLSCNSLGMVAKLTTYGLGISYLPVDYFTPLIDMGQLCIVKAAPDLPLVTYFVITRSHPSSLIDCILPVIQEVQTFEPLR